MALINCPECNKEISDKALTCPQCGFPVPEKISEDVVLKGDEGIGGSNIRKKNKKIYSKKTKIITIFTIIVVLASTSVYGLDYYYRNRVMDWDSMTINEWYDNMEKEVERFQKDIEYGDFRIVKRGKTNYSLLGTVKLNGKTPMGIWAKIIQFDSNGEFIDETTMRIPTLESGETFKFDESIYHETDTYKIETIAIFRNQDKVIEEESPKENIDQGILFHEDISTITGSYGKTFIYGELTNLNNYSIRGGKGMITFFDSKGKVLDSASFDIPRVEKKQTVSFETVIDTMTFHSHKSKIIILNKE